MIARSRVQSRRGGSGVDAGWGRLRRPCWGYPLYVGTHTHPIGQDVEECVAHVGGYH
jgi:hypothetical protein